MHIVALELRQQPAYQMQNPQGGARRPHLITYSGLTYPEASINAASSNQTINCSATLVVVNQHLAQSSSLVKGAWKMLTQCELVTHPEEQPGIT